MKDVKAKRMGRPPKADGEVRSKVFAIRLTAAEFAELVGAAELTGQHEKVADWARRMLLDHARAGVASAWGAFPHSFVGGGSFQSTTMTIPGMVPAMLVTDYAQVLREDVMPDRNERTPPPVAKPRRARRQR